MDQPINVVSYPQIALKKCTCKVVHVQVRMLILSKTELLMDLLFNLQGRTCSSILWVAFSPVHSNISKRLGI